jgi:O-antigen ligase
VALRLDPGRLLPALALALLAAALGVVAGAEPRIAIVLALGCAFVVIAFANFPVGLAVFGFLGFIEVVPSGGPFLSVTKLTGLLLALSWLAMVTTESGSRTNFITAHPTATVLIVLFLGWTALSATWAEDPSVALGSFGRFFLDAFLFMIVFSGVRNRRDAGLLAGAFLAGALAAAAYGLFASTSVNADRLGSNVLDPNELAAVLVSGTALSVALFAGFKQPGVRIFAAGAGIACLASVLLTLSRGGLIALGASLVAAIVISGRWRLPVVALVLALVIGVVTYYADFASEDSRGRVTHVTQGQDRLAEGRASLWQIAWRAVEDKPFEGLGAGNFPVSSRNYLLQPGLVQRSEEILKDLVVHNAYLEMLSEEGVVGLALYLSLIGFSLISMLKAQRLFRKGGDPGMEAFTMAVTVALVGNLVADFFISGEYSKQLWLLLGFGPALLAVAANQSDESAA